MLNKRLRNSLLITTILIGLIIIIWQVKSGTELASDPVQSDLDQIYQDYASELTHLNLDYENELARYYRELKSQAEAEWQKQLTLAEQELAESIAAYEHELELEAVELANKLRQRYEVPILNLQLRLAMISLTAAEQLELSKQLDQMRAEYGIMRNEYEIELNHKLKEFQEREIEALEARLLEWEKANAEKLSRQYEIFQAQLDLELATKKAELESNMRRAVTVRE